jgi:maleylpyruvate isomerase
VIDIDVPTQLAAIEAASAQLLATVEGIDDEAMRSASELPGWDRAMVVTHLARNADGSVGIFEGARVGRVVHQYPHGRDGRARDIEAGRGGSARDRAADVRSACGRWAEVSAAMTEADWEREGAAFGAEGEERRFPVWHMLLARRREVEVHHADLGLAYGPDDWPRGFVAGELEFVSGDLGRRLPAGMVLRLVASDGLGEWQAAGEAAPAGRELVVEGPGGQLLAWLLGRETTLTGLPEIGAWQ